MIMKITYMQINNVNNKQLALINFIIQNTQITKQQICSARKVMEKKCTDK